MSKVEKLRKKAEDAWTDCDACNSNDKSMWINGYIVGALANQIELPTDDEVWNESVEIYPYPNPLTVGLEVGTSMKRSYFTVGAKWMRDKIKGGGDE